MLQTIIEPTIILFLLVLSFIFSGSEVSLFSISEIDRLKIQREKNKKNLLIIKYLKKPEVALTTILIGNMIVNLSASIIGEQVSNEIFSQNPLFYSVLLMTFLVLLFGEIVPKNIAAYRPITFAKHFIGIIHITNRALYPVIFLMTRIIPKGEFKKDFNLSKDELLSAVDVSKEAGLDNTSISILKNLVSLMDCPATDIMIPRSDIEAININEPWSEMVKFIKETKYSQVVFHDENIDNIIGYSMKTALLNTKKKDIRNKLREPIFVPESKTILSLLGDMKLKKNHIAVILDEYGGTSGLITMKDIIDSIFIKDIIMKTYIQKKSENMWLVDGETKIVDINNAFDLFLPVESQTISGYVINMIGSIPEKGTTVRISENLMVVILESDSRQIELMELRKIDH